MTSYVIHLNFFGTMTYIHMYSYSISLSQIIYIRTFSDDDGDIFVPSSIFNRCAESFSIPLRLLFSGYFLLISLVLQIIGKLLNWVQWVSVWEADILAHHTLSLISHHQHVFKKVCLTVANVPQLTSMVIAAFTQVKQVDVIYTNFS